MISSATRADHRLYKTGAGNCDDRKGHKNVLLTAVGPDCDRAMRFLAKKLMKQTNIYQFIVPTFVVFIFKCI